MKTCQIALCIAELALVTSAFSAVVPASSNASNTLVRFEIQRGTNALGRLDVELFDQDKPQTVRNFLLYVRSGAYSNSFFHRCVPAFVVQGGGFAVTNPLDSVRFSNYVAVPDYGQLTNEFLVGPHLSSTFGTLAMAKVGGDPDSATGQWFFNLGNNTDLDTQNGGFTVFGRVLESTNANEGSNVLAHFNTLSTSGGIVNLGNLLSSNYSVFSDLPVAYTNTVSRAPTNTELYYVRVSLPNQTNQPGPAPPTIDLLSPAPNSRFTNQVVTLRGTAGDDAEVARVVYRVQGGPLEIGAGTTNWEINLAPQAGFNTVAVESLDWNGQRSTNAASVTFYYVATMPLRLQVTGQGRVTGATNGQFLQAGSFYTLTARPDSGYVFDGWTGSVTSATTVLTFQVPANATNFNLNARFARSPFVRLAGTYHGLFHFAPSNTLENSGFLTLTLGRGGGFSGKILHRSGSYSYTGRFAENGIASFIQGSVGGVSRTLSLALQTTNEAGLITGSLSGTGTGNATVDVQLERLASALPSTNGPPSGNYTFALPASATNAPSQTIPGAPGIGTGSLNRNGVLTLSGNLGDGTAFATSARLTRQNRWPIYQSLFRGQGVLIGWAMPATNQPANLDGSLLWVKSPAAKSTTYPAGFAIDVAFQAAPNFRPTGDVRVLNWVNGLAQLAGANLVLGVTNSVKLATNNTVTAVGPNPAALNVILDPKTGRVRGGFAHPWAGTSNMLRGIILKRAEGIRGQFLDGNQVGRLTIDASPFLPTQNVANVTLPALTDALREGGLLRFESDGIITVTNPLSIVFPTALDANGHNVVISGGGTTRLFEVPTNVTFFATGITFADGRVDGTNGSNEQPSVPVQPGGDACGAGILNLGGTVALTNCVATNFIAQGGNGGGVQSIGSVGAGGRGLGGAICNLGGRLILQGCQLIGNRALGGSGNRASTGRTVLTLPGSGLGGAVFSDGDVETRETLFLGNEATGGPSASCCNNAASFTEPGHAAGGALVMAQGRLILSSSQCRSNTAAGGAELGPGGNVNSGGHGGSLFVETNAQAVIQQTVFADNRASAAGLVVNSNTIPGESRGGAIFSAGLLTLRESTLERNTAVGGGTPPAPARGGGVASVGALVIDASTLSENTASGGQSGLSSTELTPAAEGAGGGVYALSGSVSATNSTFVGNRVIGSAPCPFLCPTNDIPRGDGRGGAITVVSNSATLVNVTIAFNQAEPGALGDANTGGAFGGAIANLGAALTLRNSIVASNTPGNFFGGLNDAGYNLSSDDSFILIGSGSLMNTNPFLGPLTTNGGPTRTMTLLFGSPARDAILTTSIPPVDQRGVSRPRGLRGDIGALEVVPTVPEVSISPTSVTNRVGTNFTFQSSTDGATPLSYFWLLNGVLIPNATNKNLLLANIQLTNAGNYVLVVTNSFGAVTSAVATLTVDASPRIVFHPNDAMVSPNGGTNFTVIADGPSLTYQWFHDDLPLPDKTNAVLNITNAQPGAQGRYQVIVTNFAGADTSRVATLTFDALALAIVSPPQDISATQGQPVIFEVSVSGIGPFTYQWFLNSIPVVGPTTSLSFSNELFFANVDSTNAGAYRVVVTNAYNAVTSAPAQLTVVAPFRAASASSILALALQRQDSNVVLICHGPPGHVVHLQRATSIAPGAIWQPMATNVIPAAGTLSWPCPMTPDRPLFFRAAAP